MATNRYSNRYISQFNPLSMEQIFAVPMAKRQQHDNALKEAVENSVFDVNRLAVDDPRVNEIIRNQQGKFDSFINKLNTEGFNRNTTGDLINLNRQKQDLFSPTGELGRAEAAYNSYQSNSKELQDMYQKGKISAEKYRLGLRNALNSYKGIVEGDSYNPFTAVADTDYVEKARKIANDIRQKPDLLESAGYKLTEDGAMYIKTKTGKEFTREGAISDAVANILMADQAVISDLMQRESLGMLGKAGAAGTILELANTLERDYSVDRKKFDITLTGNKAFSKDENVDGVVSTSLPTTYKERFGQNQIDKLDFVANNTTKQVPGIPPLDASGIGAGMMTQGTEDRIENVTLETELGEEGAKAVKEDYENLLKLPNNRLDPNASDQEIARVVSNYRKKYKDVSHSDQLLQIGSASNSLDGAVSVKNNAVKDPSRYASLSVKVNGATMWDYDTKELIPVKDIDFKNGDFEYAGTIASDNTLNGYEDMSPDQSAVPDLFAYTDSDGEVRKILISKPDSEMSKPSVKAASFVKQIFNQTFNKPAQPLTIKPPVDLQKKGLDEINIIYYPSQVHGNEQEYGVQLKLSDGTIFGGEKGDNVSMSELKELIHSFYTGSKND